MKITKNGDDTYTYERKVKERSWDDKMYFFPIPQSENLRILIWSRIRGGNPQPEC